MLCARAEQSDVNCEETRSMDSLFKGRQWPGISYSLPHTVNLQQIIANNP